MKSKIFFSDEYKRIETDVIKLLNKQPDFLSASTAESTRATGDAVEKILTEKFDSVLGDFCSEYSTNFARRSMADLAFNDKDGFYYIIDVKTHRSDTKFNMPNLTSVERLSRLYEDDLNYFVLLFITYHVETTKVIITGAKFIPIEFLDWSCLTIGALGWGQIQVANSNNVLINVKYSRKKWMLEFCEIMFEFYPKEISKINTRIERFVQVRNFWLEKPDD